MVNFPGKKIKMPDWSEKIQEIAKDWLFSDLDLERFPKNIILPLENPDLYARCFYLQNDSSTKL